MLDRRTFLGTLAVPLLGYQRAGAELTFSANGAIRCSREGGRVVPRLLVVNGQEFPLVRQAGKLGVEGEAGQLMDAFPGFQGALHKLVVDLLMNRMDALIGQGRLGFKPGEDPDQVRGRYEKQVAQLVGSLGNSYDRLRSLHVLLYPREQPTPSGQWALLDRAAEKERARQQIARAGKRKKGDRDTGGGAQRSSNPGDNEHEGDPDAGSDLDFSFEDVFFYSTRVSFDTFVSGLTVAGAAVVIAMALADPAISSLLLTGAVTATAGGLTVAGYLAGEAVRRWGNQLQPYLPFSEVMP